MAWLEPKQGPDCPRCPLFQDGIKIDDKMPMPGRYCGLTVIGDMPGRLEVEKRQVLVGPSGGLLGSLASVMGMDMDTVHLTSCIRCGMRGGRKPTEAEGVLAADCCKSLVNENLRRMGTKTALCIGSISWSSLSGFKGIDKYRGTVLPPEENEPWYLTCSLHPGGLLYVASRSIMVDLLYADLRKAWQLATGDVSLWEPTIGDPSDVEALVVFLRTVRDQVIPVACDVETDGEQAFDFNRKPCSLLVNGLAAVINDELISYSIPYVDAYPDYYIDSDWVRIDELVRGIFKNTKQSVVFHNKRFDVPVLERYYGYLSCVKEDTILLHHATYPKLPHNLGSVAAQFLPIEPWKSEYKDTEGSIFKEHASLMDDWDDLATQERQEALIRIRDLKRTSTEELLWYNAMDAATTIFLFHRLVAEAKEDAVYSVYLTDRELDDETLNWQYNGICIDLDERAKLEVIYDKKLTDTLAGMRKECLLPTDKDVRRELDPLSKERVVYAEHGKQMGRISILMRKAYAMAISKEDAIQCALVYLPSSKHKEDQHNKLCDQLASFDGEEKTQKEQHIVRLARDIADIELAKAYMHMGSSWEVALDQSKRAKTKAKDLHVRIKELQKKPTQENFMPGSANHIREVLSLRGLSPIKVCKKAVDKNGNRLLAVSKDSLWDLRDDMFVNTLFTYRTDAKLQSTYIRNLEHKLGVDGRLHPNWRIPATPSGRFGTQPACQNWPDSMKKLMVASSGNVIVGADYAALELRIVALLGDEQEWLKLFLDDGDLHSLMAHKYFSKEYPELDAQWLAVEGSEDVKNLALPRRKELRKRGKNITFGDIYLAGAETLYYQIREKMPDVKTEAEHRALRTEVAKNQRVLRAATPNRIEFAAISQRFASKNHYLCTPSWEDQYGVMCGGRVRKWPLGEPSPNETANHPIQGMAADIMNNATLRFVKTLKEDGLYNDGAWIILQIHDALYLEVADEHKEKVRLMLEQALYTEINFRSPVTNKLNFMRFTADASIGESVARIG